MCRCVYVCICAYICVYIIYATFLTFVTIVTYVTYVTCVLYVTYAKCNARHICNICNRCTICSICNCTVLYCIVLYCTVLYVQRAQHTVRNTSAQDSKHAHVHPLHSCTVATRGEDRTALLRPLHLWGSFLTCVPASFPQFLCGPCVQR